jgi:hypothetical protein
MGEQLPASWRIAEASDLAGHARRELEITHVTGRKHCHLDAWWQVLNQA